MSAFVPMVIELLLVPSACALAPFSEIAPPPPPSATATEPMRLSVRMRMFSPLSDAPPLTVMSVVTTWLDVVFASWFSNRMPPVVPPAEPVTTPSAELGMLKPAAPPTPSNRPEIKLLVMS